MLTSDQKNQEKLDDVDFQIQVLGMIQDCLDDQPQGVYSSIPDRTHFHHLFVDMGFACYITTFLLLLLSTVVFAGWFMTAALGWCVTVQLVVMVVWAMVVFWGVSGFMVRLKKGNPERYENYRSKAIALSKRSHVFFKMLQGLMDRKNARK